ncbi:VCBS repeat-containing protein [Sorangium sp. So ce134]
MRCLCAVAMMLAVLGCASLVDPLDEGGAAAPSTSSPGVAAQRSSRYGWKGFLALDFNFDGMADVLWDDEDRSLMAVWFMNGTELLAPGPILHGPSGEGWLAVGSDFDADGLTDVLWHHDERNLITIWPMDGGRPLAPGPILQGPSGGSWDIRPNDFNRDNMSDVLWYDAAQNLMTVWLMNGTEVQARGPFLPGPSGGRWNVGPVPDVNFDRMADVIWYEPEQNLMTVWLMNGTELLAPGPVIPGPSGEGWALFWASDVSGDGVPDVLWINEERGLMTVWLMNGTELLAPGPVIPGPSGDGWRAFAAGDVNFDRMADVVWQRAGTSEMVVWLMNGSEPLARGPLLRGPYGG